MSEQATELKANENGHVLDLIAGEIEEGNGFISFERFMELALYHPQLGYYTKNIKRVGKDADFITSVSVGKCYGLILAHHFSTILKTFSNFSKEVVVVELGAENGDLALDIMGELSMLLSKDLFGRLNYIIVEPFSFKRQALKARLSSERIGNISVISDLEKENNLYGVLIGNEVLDALPFRRVRLRDKKWMELGVGINRDGEKKKLIEAEKCIHNESLISRVADFPKELPDGFTAEVNINFKQLLSGISSSFVKLEGYFVDYGSSHDELMDLSRSEGTVRAYSGHQYVKNVLLSPGSNDITSNVDFDWFRASAKKHEFITNEPIDQYRFLTNAAEPWLLKIEKSGIQNVENMKLINQFKMLIHPTTMGRAFKVLKFQK